MGLLVGAKDETLNFNQSLKHQNKLKSRAAK